MQYEELSLNAYPALQTLLYDGWVLRFADGYAYSANSISPIYPSTIDIQTKISECESYYSAHGLSDIYRLTDGCHTSIDKVLEQKRYTIATPTNVMNMNMQIIDFCSKDCTISGHVDDEWLASYFAFINYSNTTNIAIAKKILNNIKNTVLCGRVIKDGDCVACVLAVIERGYVRLMNIAVDEFQRGKGYGKEICKSLLSAAKDLGAHTTYVHVLKSNDKALNLYEKLGYKHLYLYWYRVKKSR